MHNILKYVFSNSRTRTNSKIKLKKIKVIEEYKKRNLVYFNKFIKDYNYFNNFINLCSKKPENLTSENLKSY